MSIRSLGLDRKPGSDQLVHSDNAYTSPFPAFPAGARRPSGESFALSSPTPPPSPLLTGVGYLSRDRGSRCPCPLLLAPANPSAPLPAPTPPSARRETSAQDSAVGVAERAISFAATSIAAAARWAAGFDDADGDADPDPDPGGAVFPRELLRGVLEVELPSAAPPVGALSLTGAGFSRLLLKEIPVRRFLVVAGAGEARRRRRWPAMPGGELDDNEASLSLVALYLARANEVWTSRARAGRDHRSCHQGRRSWGRGLRGYLFLPIGL